MLPNILCGLFLVIAVGFAVWALITRSRCAALQASEAQLQASHAQLQVGHTQLQDRVSASERQNIELSARLQVYAPIVDLETQRQKLAEDLSREWQRAQATWQEIANQTAMHQREAQSAIDAFANTRAALERDVATLTFHLGHLDERAMFVDHGLYENVYDFVTSDKYKARLETVRERQKAMVKAKQAAICAIQWTVEGSTAKGAKMVADTLKLMLRAFNGECDAAVYKVRYNNVHALINRIEKSFETINKLASVNRCEITRAYLDYKLEELRLTHEYQQKCEDEREEQRRIKEQIREEAKVAKEIEKAQREAEREEAKLAKLLEEAREQAEAAVGVKQQRLLGRIKELERQLETAAAQKQRARARAEFTRAGHVYVISNIGSFGEGIYKIGMTRRIEPYDRVRELGDASVPFQFDVHAMISTEDAPSLEAKLHALFSRRRVNLVNQRKEFFEVSLEEIEAAVIKHHGVFEFIKDPDAEEYRQSTVIRGTQVSAPNFAQVG